MEEKKNNLPVFVMSGLSGTGKSGLLEAMRWEGLTPIKSYTKFLLENNFGYGVQGSDHIIINEFMTMYQQMDSEWLKGGRPWIIERSIIDGYYFRVLSCKSYEDFDKLDEDKMMDMIEKYFWMATDSWNRNLYIIDIYNYDRDWISKCLSENQWRSEIFKSVDEYLEIQEDYKSVFKNTVKELPGFHEFIELRIDDITKFDKDARYKFIIDNILPRC